MKILCYQGTFGNFLINDVCNPPPPPPAKLQKCALSIYYIERLSHTHTVKQGALS